MKKLILIAAMLAMLVVTAVPALADRNNHHRFFNNDNGVRQSNEQEVESGDATQNINVKGGGDNSNACQGVQGITNTGNATNNTGVLQYANRDAEVEVDDSGNFEISPSQTTTCDQQVNQAASASGR
jgi:hypothetical protein